MRTRRQERLGLLRLVLWARFRGRDNAALPGQTVYGEMFEPALQRSSDTVHALLPMVPNESQEALEDRG